VTVANVVMLCSRLKLYLFGSHNIINMYLIVVIVFLLILVVFVVNCCYELSEYCCLLVFSAFVLSTPHCSLSSGECQLLPDISC